MLREMTWKQFIGWMRYYSEEPFGEERADLRSAIVACVIANANRDPKKRPRPFSPQDFMPLAKRQSGGYKPITDPKKWKEMTQVMRTAYGKRKQVKAT